MQTGLSSSTLRLRCSQSLGSRLRLVLPCHGTLWCMGQGWVLGQGWWLQTFGALGMTDPRIISKGLG